MKINHASAGGLYIHIPFCRTICPYCNFAVVRDNGRHMAYIGALVQSIENDPPPFPVQSIYIGGGTPSRLDPSEWRALADVLKKFVTEYSEFTVEANPEDLTEAYLDQLRTLGINRLSVGVQRLDHAGLKRLGRARSVDAVEELPGLLEYWSSIGGQASVDLIYGIKDDRPDVVAEQVDTVLAWPIEHLSAYALTIENGTPYENGQHMGQQFAAPDDDIASCYKAVLHTVQEHGWNAYEVSNFCKPGFRAQHNSGYWQSRPYMGYGLASVSRLDDGQHGHRFSRLRALDAFISVPAERVDCEQLTPDMVVTESIMLGLRSYVGAPKSLWDKWQARNPAYTNQLLATGILELNGDHVLMRPEHRLMTDEVAAKWVESIL